MRDAERGGDKGKVGTETEDRAGGEGGSEGRTEGGRDREREIERERCGLCLVVCPQY